MKATGLQRFIQRLAAMRFNSWWLSKLLYKIDPIVMKRSGGKRSLTSSLTGLPVLILKVKGAKSGLVRRTPLVGLFNKGKIILIASYFGKSKHPAWYHNIKANPKVQVEFKGIEKDYRAFEAQGKERQKYWELAENFFVGYKNYKKLAGDRQIPVMVLELIN